MARDDYSGVVSLAVGAVVVFALYQMGIFRQMFTWLQWHTPLNQIMPPTVASGTRDPLMPPALSSLPMGPLPGIILSGPATMPILAPNIPLPEPPELQDGS